MSKLFFGGVPTAMDVRKLEQAFGKPEVGAEVQHERIEAVLGLARSASRYRTIVSAWRKKLLRDHNVDMGAIPAVGFRALNEAERVSVGILGVQQGVRKQLRSIRRADVVQTDDPVLTFKQDVLRRYGSFLAAEAGKVMRQIAPPKPIEQQPKPIPKA